MKVLLSIVDLKTWVLLLHKEYFTRQLGFKSLLNLVDLKTKTKLTLIGLNFFGTLLEQFEIYPPKTNKIARANGILLNT